ncbi:hypothetical protein C0993_010284 [Termitomyces sp. T159_Od127]|nr:hypothetical protein C0993_010284 [Termitomyces sp. T159_Od127]
MDNRMERDEGYIAKEPEGRSKLPGWSISSGYLMPLTWDFQEWKEAAVILDEYLHFHEWKSIDEDSFYDWKLVKKAFLDANLLPRVVTGTSAGGLIAALVCTRTDEELKHLLVPELANRVTACEEPYTVWMKRLWRTGARFDSVS